MERTIGDFLNELKAIKTEEEAQAYVEKEIKATMELVKDREEAERIVRSNIGYVSGYCGPDEMVRIQQLFKSAHPIFGFAIVPTPEEAFEMGKQWSQQREAKKNEGK